MSGQTVKTTCPYCGVGCGVLVHRSNDGSVCIKGDADHPANFGRLCSKGTALGETLGLEHRLLHPLVEGRQESWASAVDVVAQRFTQTIKQYGPNSVAFYVSGQLLTEDYYLANKLMKGFIGSANIDTNSRLCMSSAVAAHKRAFGADTVPGCYEDLELADVVVLWGSNMAWCHPVLYQRLEAAKIKRPQMKVILIDPRRTATAELCDLHLAIQPGKDTVLINGLLAHLQASGKRDKPFVTAHTNGIEEALQAIGTADILEIAQACGLEVADIDKFYHWFTAHEKSMSVYSQGVTMSSSGTDKVNAILNCHLFTGRIGRPGMGPFSLTGQPNAMGGREVGGLANQLAAHMDLDNADHRQIVKGFWQAPHLPDKPGSIFMPIHWSDQFASAARVDMLVSANCDPLSGQPESKHARVKISRYRARWHAFAISAQRANRPESDYWSTSRCHHGWRLEMANKTEPANLLTYVSRLFDLSQRQLEDGVMFHDRKNNRTHLAFFEADRLVAALYSASTPVTVARAWTDQQLGQNFDNGVSRLHLLAALPGQNQPDKGAIICACFSVGKNQITEAITTKGCTTIDAIGTCLQAGTNCGSCRSEIKRLIAQYTPDAEKHILQVAG